MKNVLIKGIALVLLLTIPVALLNGQSISEIVDTFKNAESWTDILGLYDVIAAMLIVLVTQLRNIFPFLKVIKGPWLALIVTVVLLVGGSIMFGVQSLLSPVVMWAVVTLVYDKFLKKEPVKE